MFCLNMLTLNLNVSQILTYCTQCSDEGGTLLILHHSYVYVGK